MKVLLVTKDPAQNPIWIESDETNFELARVGTLAEANRLLDSQSVDVVVLDAAAVAAESDQLCALGEKAGHAALIVHAPQDGPQVEQLKGHLPEARVLVPDFGRLSAQLVELAGECARHTAEQRKRVAELEERTRELEASRARFRDVIERNADAILVVDRDGVVRFVNGVTARLLKTTVDDMIGSSFGFPLVEGETSELDLIRSGETRVVEMRVVESEWEGQRAFIASLRDITERKRAEESARQLIREQAARLAAEQANQVKSDYLATISHDLRTPLNAIIGHSDLLSMGIPDRLSEAGLQRVERIRVSAAHLIYLIDQLLSFARLEAGREELHPRDVDAGDVAREVAAVVEPLALEKSLSFQLEVPPHLIQMRTDPDRLRQVLLNLVGNAVRYTPEGCVALRMDAATDGFIAFHVCDTGVGIRPEHLEKIFEPFWQVDSGQRSSIGGTGLGLSVVRHLVGLLGGNLSVESEVGKGSVFTVRLPTNGNFEF